VLGHLTSPTKARVTRAASAIATTAAVCPGGSAPYALRNCQASRFPVRARLFRRAPRFSARFAFAVRGSGAAWQSR
jgi:hypothetical protein